MRKTFLLAVALLVATVNSVVAASTVSALHSGVDNLLLFEAVIDAGDTILTPVISLGSQGDVVPAEQLVVQGTSTAAVAVNVDVHVAADIKDTFFEMTDDEIALAGASPQVASSDLDDHEPYLKLELENAGAASATVRISLWITDRFAAQENRGELKTLDPSRQAPTTTALAASGGTVSTPWFSVVGKNRLGLYVQPTATGLTYDVDGRVNLGGTAGEALSMVSGSAVGAVDTRLEVDLSAWGVTEVRVTYDNPTVGIITLVDSAVALP